MKTNIQVQTFEQNHIEFKIKAITQKVNERIAFIFDGKINDIYELQNNLIHNPTALIIRVWNKLDRKYPGMRDILLNQGIQGE